MNQSFEVQLAVIRRALGDVIAPALSNAEKHVLEQLHLSLIALDFMQDRLPKARSYYRLELELHRDLGAAVVDLLACHSAKATHSLLPFLESCQVSLDDPKAEWSDYIRISRGIREAVAATVADAEGAAYEKELDALIIDKNEFILLQARIWAAPFGFELNPEALPSGEWEKDNQRNLANEVGS